MKCSRGGTGREEEEEEEEEEEGDCKTWRETQHVEVMMTAT